MAVRFVQVPETEKDKEGVQETVTPVVVNGQTVETRIYGRTVIHCDIEPDVTADVQSVEIVVPVWADEEYETGEQNEDGSNTIAVRQTLKTERRVVDLGPDSLKALQEALQPFAVVSRPAEEPTAKKRGRPAKKAAQTPPSAS
ncbi:hypothetical protein [Streptomyces botrytidirepellens]|uniref:Uncharacterized protein n=1 Tax=Streptomyces botrytidirepellens TaxID=2486417 RepID=A0A3M8WBH5_9ACTN|nr:hypothetical protein [Streptomyces botrytidirepellens]RNG26069.1 hypothetical protein EEJ42_16265 [Streptomyces botrytidirepellens]